MAEQPDLLAADAAVSSPVRHVVEQPDLLAADAEWRKTLSEIVKGLTKNMPGIQHLLRISHGGLDDAENQWAATVQLMETLGLLRERQEAAVLALEHSRGLWTTAIRSRNGELGQLDVQWDGLKERNRELENTVGSMEERHQQVETQLASLAQQQRVADETLNRTQENQDLIVQGHRMDQERLDEREARHREMVTTYERAERRRTQDLVRRERALEPREAAITARWGECDIRSNNLHAQEIAIDESKLIVDQDRNRNDAAGQNLQRALSILHNLVNAAGDEYNGMPTLEDIQDLAAAIQTRVSTLQDTISEKDRNLTTQQQQITDVTRQLEAKTQESDTRMNTLQARIADYNRLVMLHRTSLAEMKGLRAGDQELIRELQTNSIPRLEAAENSLKSEVERLEEDKRRLRLIDAAKSTEIGLLKENLSKEVESRKRLEDSDRQRHAMLFESSALRRDNAELTTQLTNAKDNLDKRVTECQTFKVAAENDKTKITGMESLCIEKDSQIQRRDSQIRDLQECRRSLESEDGRKDSEILDLMKRQKFLESEIEGRDSEILNLKEGLQSLESEVDGRDSQILALDQGRQTLEAQNQKELNELQHELTAKQATVNSLTTALTAQQAADQQLEQQTDIINSLNERLRASEAKYQKATEQSNEMSRKIEKVQSLARSLKSELQEANGSLQTAQECNTSLAEQADDKTKECNRLQDDIRHLQTVTIPEKEASIRNLYDEVADQDTQASDVQRSLHQKIWGLEAKNSKLQDYIKERESERKNDLVGYALPLSLRMKLTDVQDTMNIQTTELNRLMTRLQSCRCSDERSSLKRQYDRVDDEEEVSSPDRPARSARRLEKAPESALRTTPVRTGPSGDTNPLDDAARPRTPAPREQGAAAGLNSRDELEQSLGFQHGTRWRIDDVLDKDFTADPIPQAILKKLRGKIRGWDKTRENWRAGSSDRLPKCAESFSFKRGTHWVNDNCHRACSYCTDRRLLCVAVVNHHIEILPANGSVESGLDMADSRYWLGT